MNEEVSPKSDSEPDYFSGQTCCPIMELRQYTLHPGARDVLIALFEREFLESQEALGMKVIGQFRDLDDPDRFVWLRGFRDMPTRAEALAVFYGGPVWKAHRDVANATMIDSDNVLLLRPAETGSGFPLTMNDRPPPDATETPTGLVIATICYFERPVEDDFVEFFSYVVKPVLSDAGASVLAYFVTESSKNNFSALPVREGEHVFVWFSSFQNGAVYEHHATELAQTSLWKNKISRDLTHQLKGNPEILKLVPTARSQLR